MNTLRLSTQRVEDDLARKANQTAEQERRLKHMLAQTMTFAEFRARFGE